MKSLAAIAVQLFSNESRLRAEYSGPVFVWEGAAEAPLESILSTKAGLDRAPQQGDALVFQVAKRAKKLDAFAMGVTLGHADNNDIVLADPTVSRFHAYLPLDATGKSWRIVDADSKHGVWVNDERTEPGKPLELHSQDRVRLGHATLLFLSSEDFFEYLATRS